MLRLSSGWWRPAYIGQPLDHYDWLSGYLHARGMSTATRVMMATITGAMAMSTVTLTLDAGGPRGHVALTAMGVALLGGVAGFLLWTSRWPTRTQSLAFGLASNACIALACLAYPNPLAALTGCIAFATIGAYLAFFHTTRLVLYNFTVAAVVALIQAVALARTGHLPLALVDLFLVLQVNIALPLAIRALVHALSVDLLHSDRDPLTGLYNRRSFHDKTLGLLVARETTDTHLTVVMIDLDSFKVLNDTHGHTAGDRALVRVAQALRIASDAKDVIARSGGEEFLIAQVSTNPDPTKIAQRLCNAIAALPTKVTASIGTASAPLDNNGFATHQALIAQLTSDADEAMYIAKRSGGNRVHHHGAPDPVH